MKTLTRVALAFLFSASSFMYAAGDSTRPASVQTKGIMLSGKVTEDGKQFVADDDNRWSISNTEATRGLESRYAIVKCRMDVAKRAIHVLSVEEPAESKHKAHLGDAAFRR